MTRFIVLLFSVFLIFGCTRKEKPLGTKENPIKIYIVPGKEADAILRSAQQLEQWLAKETGLTFKSAVPNSYVAVIEALGTKRADIAALSTSSYLMAREKYQVEPIFMTTVNGIARYKGEIITHVNGLKKIEDINGKKMAYSDPASASGHILVANMLKEKGITPKEVVFAGGHDAVVTMVYTQKVDAGATFFSEPEDGVPKDARRLVKTQFPDVFEKVKVLAYTDEIPSDCFAIRKDFPPELKEKVVTAIEKWSHSPEGKKTLKEMNNSNGLIRAKDQDYDHARKLLKLE
jgi:phosphonate transport system substrate-binding protein